MSGRPCLRTPDRLDGGPTAGWPKLPPHRRIGAKLMTARTARKVEIQKKKRRRAIPRAAVTRNQGNTAGARTRLKKAAGLRRGKKA